MNVGAPSRGGEDMLDAFTATLSEAFPHVYRFEKANANVPFSNFIYMGSRRELDPDRLNLLRGMLPGQLIRAVTRAWEAPTAPPGTLVFTDDRSPVELFVHQAIFRAATAPTGSAGE